MIRPSRRLSRLAVVAAAGALVPTAAAIVTGGTPASACLYSVNGCGGGSTFSITPTQVETPVGIGVSLTAHYGSVTLNDVTASTTFSMDGGTCNANVCTPATSGTHVVNASYSGGWRATATITSDPGDYLFLTPDEAVTFLGQTVAYQVLAVAADGNILSDVTAGATVTEDGVACLNAVCPADTLGPHRIDASNGTYHEFGTLTVEAAPPAQLVVNSSAGTLSPGVAHAFTAEAYDAAGDDLGDATNNAAFYMSPDGSCVNAQCTPATAGPHTVTARLGTATGTLNVSVIAPLSVRVGNKVTWEGNTGHHVVWVPMTLSATATSPVVIQWTTQDGTATAGSDYLARSGTVTIGPGYRSAAMPVTILGDKIKEPNETLRVILTSVSGASPIAPVGSVIIKNDD